MTVKQVQCLLAYLGYYEGALDGIWGPLSRTAGEGFQRDFGGLKIDGIPGPQTAKALKQAIMNGMPEKQLPQETEDVWEKIVFFKREEFRCKCGGVYCNGYPAEMQRKVVELADGARAYFGSPGHVISGLRCPHHNANCGGAAQSRHMQGKAIDLRIDGVTADRLLEYLRKQAGVRYAYKINSTNVHFDIF